MQSQTLHEYRQQQDVKQDDQFGRRNKINFAILTNLTRYVVESFDSQLILPLGVVVQICRPNLFYYNYVAESVFYGRQER